MNLTPEEKRHALLAISNQIDNYSAAIRRTPSFKEHSLLQLDEEKKLLISAYHKIRTQA